MSRTTFIIVFVLINCSCYSQVYFNLKGKANVREYIREEKLLNSLLIANRTIYEFPQSPFHLDQPLRYIRMNQSFSPRPIIEYYFSLPDSIVREINVELDSLNFLDPSDSVRNTYKEPLTRLKDFDRQYDLIRNEIIEDFGPPKSTAALDKQFEFDSFYWSRSDEWRNDSVTLTMYLTFSGRKHAGGTYRIRANLYYHMPAEKLPPAVANGRLLSRPQMKMAASAATDNR